MRNALALLIVFASLIDRFPAADSKYVRRDLGTIAADYLIVAPPAFADKLDALCDHRSKSYRVAVARTDDISVRLGGGPEGIAKLVAAVRPRFLLLAGDVDTVPTFRRTSEYVSDKFMSDPDLATDHLFGAAAGRFPADTPEELRAMIEKTIEHETSAPPGRWRKKIAFIAGQGGFGEMIDMMIEQQFAALVTDHIPPAYDVELAYAKPTSKYCAYPPKFNENAVRLLNDGALFYVYVGHGQRTGVDAVDYNGLSYPVFDAKNVKEVEVRGGMPIMVVIACNTGEFDSRQGDCIGEDLFKRRRGPIAFIGGTRVTQPYGNALLGHHLVDQIFRKKARTVGEALQAARASVLEKDGSKLRLQADALAALVQGPSSLEPMRKDVVLHYNLLGDPALAIPRPTEEIEIETFGFTAPGKTLRVIGKSNASSVEVTFECPRGKFHHPTDLVGEDVAAQLARRYANANNKVIAKAEAPVRDGVFEAEFALPATLKPGTYYVKAWAAGAIGAHRVEIVE